MSDALGLDGTFNIQNLLNSMGDDVGIINVDYKIIFQNDVGKEIHGDHIGEECFKVFANREKVCDDCPSTKVFESGKTSTSEQTSYDSMQNKHFVEIMASPIKNNEGKVVASIEIVRDITQRKKDENKLISIRKAVDSASDAIGISDSQGRHFYQNKALSDLFEYSTAEELEAAGGGAAVVNDPQVGKEMFDAIKDGNSWAGELDMITKSGRIFTAFERADAIKNDEGDIIGLIGIITDITELKRAEADFKRIFNLSSDMICIADIDGYFRKINPAFSKILGYSDDEILGKPFMDFIHLDDRLATKKIIEEKLAKGALVYNFQNRYRCKNGQYRNLEWVSNPIANEGVTFAIARDITERKQAAEKIQKSEEYIRNILNTVDDGFIVVDRDYRIMTANHAYCSQVSLTSDKVIGMHCYEVSHLAERPCFEDGEDCPVKEAFSTGVSHAAVHKHLSADEEILYVETKAFPQKDKSGNVISVIETTRNITERHLLEAEQLKTQKLEAIGTLAGGIAHDFNNLLQGVFGYVSMAKITSNQPDKVIENLDQAEKALSLSVNLTSQLLTFAKGGKPVKKKVDLKPIIENATKFALSGSRCDCRLHIDPNLYSAEVDHGQIAQVIQNIVLNASEAMPEGGLVCLSAENIILPQGGRQMRITIKDTGIGIPESFLTKIFDPYFTTKHRGSGLGLATSYSIVKNHEGWINVESKQDKGTTFIITLPACEPVVLEKKASQLDLEVQKQKGRILLMDDEPMIRSLAQRMIETLGHDIDLACHGEEVIGKYQEALVSDNPFDLVILDLTIKGGMGGQETIRKLQEIDPNVKAIVSSGYSADPVVSEYYDNGFQGMLNKPYTIIELKECFNKML